MQRTIAGVMKWGKWGANFTVPKMEKLILDCLKAGITVFDHADIYGDYTTEEEWGAAWSHLHIPRSNIKIITKCGICHPCENRFNYKIKSYDTSASHIIDSAKRSIENLHCEYLDVLLIHRPSPLMNPIEMAEAFSQLESEGIVRSFGVSNFTMTQMELLRKHYPIGVNQIEISLWQLESFMDGTIDYCLQQEIEVQAWSPLASGQLFSKSKDYEFVTRRARLKAVADKYGWDLDEMAYLFLLHHPARIRPVVGSSKIKRITLALEAENTTITDEQWFEIWTASQGVDVP